MTIPPVASALEAASSDLAAHVDALALTLRSLFAREAPQPGGGREQAVVVALTTMVEAKDSYTRGHLDRTHGYARALAARVAPELADDPVIGYGFLLHDVGKVGVPESVLCKPAPLDEDEWSVMRRHPELGAGLIDGVPSLAAAVPILRHHHERWDGAGYPDGLRGADIPVAARIFSIVDTFDAMTSERPYRQALSFEESLQQVREGAGSQFDPEMASCFVEIADELHEASLR